MNRNVWANYTEEELMKAAQEASLQSDQAHADLKGFDMSEWDAIHAEIQRLTAREDEIKTAWRHKRQEYIDADAASRRADTMYRRWLFLRDHPEGK